MHYIDTYIGMAGKHKLLLINTCQFIDKRCQFIVYSPATGRRSSDVHTKQK